MTQLVKKISKKIIVLIILGFVVGATCYFAPSQAADVSDFSDVLSKQGLGDFSNHTISFKITSSIDPGDTLELVFDGNFSMNLIDYTDIDFADDGIDQTLGTSASGATWGAVLSGQRLTFTSGTTTIAGGSVVTIEIGDNATFQHTGDRQIQNPATPGGYILTLEGTFGDQDVAGVAVTDNKVGLVANVQSTSVGGDNTAPIITNVQVINLTPTSATITWETNENANSFVDYGLTDFYEIGTEFDSAYVMFHSVDLTNLTPGTTYHFTVRSADISGNMATTIDYTFTTPETEDLYLFFRALPEKRLPAQGNNHTEIWIRMYEAGTSNLVAEQEVSTDMDGYDSEVSLEANNVVLPAQYDFYLKGWSHLWFEKKDVTVDDSGLMIDFSESETKFLKAGDVNDGWGDNLVNGMDLSIITNHIYTDDYKNDLNQDKLVNGLEFAIAVTNLGVFGATLPENQ